MRWLNEFSGSQLSGKTLLLMYAKQWCQCGQKIKLYQHDDLYMSIETSGQ